jgi:hypothetical protein
MELVKTNDRNYVLDSKSNALLNTDLTKLEAYKLEVKKELERQQLVRRVELLEATVKILEEKILNG